jgi:DNA-directed RNA polymerase subunit RPC12/RpoP
MPIRFRCVYCEKLLGIARRKSGAIVDCPHCGEKLIVPTPDPSDETAAAADEFKATDEVKALAAAPGAQLFERSDFEALLHPEPTFRTGDDDAHPPKPAKSPRPVVSATVDPIPAPKPVAPVPLPSLMNSTPEPTGFFISSSRATWLSVAAVVALATAFSIGLLVGRFFRPT